MCWPGSRLSCPPKFDEALVDRNGDSRRVIGDFELLENVHQMSLDRGLADVEFVARLLVVHAASHQLENRAFTCTQRFRGWRPDVVQQPASDRRC